MKKRIKRNATKQIEQILNRVIEIEYFTSENNYNGGKIEKGFESEKKKKYFFDDIKAGYAILFVTEDKQARIKYVGCTRLELTLR